MAKTFTHVGISIYEKNGTAKVRFTNDVMSYSKGLERINFPPVPFFTLPHPMTKLEAANYISNLGHLVDGITEEQFNEALSRVIKRNTPKAPGAKRGRPRKKPIATPNID